MVEKITPEQAGISSKNILKMLKVFENKHYYMHSVIMAHHGKVFFEQYWDPYDENSLHRLYSASKSFVSLAIGFLYDEGKIQLDDKIIKYFPEYSAVAAEYLKEQTVRDMLKMSTASLDTHWMTLGIQNRTEYYFTREQNRPSATLYNYDSTGSYLLGVVVQKITGKSFIDYLKEKLFAKIGVGDDICCLRTPEGHLWGDSGILCRAIDFYKVAQFATNMGEWNGVQLLSREYMEAATSMQVFNAVDGLSNYRGYGYGYQFWRTRDNGFYFSGRGGQYAICLPEKDFVFVCTGANHDPAFGEIVFDSVFEEIVTSLSDIEIEGQKDAFEELQNYCKTLKLGCVKGNLFSEFEKTINGVSYTLKENPMKIGKLTLFFEENHVGKLVFEDNDGVHELPFGLGKNVFTLFPMESMSDEIGNEVKKGYQHRCAVSGAWVEEQKLFILVQVIDKYLSKLHISIGFHDDKVGLEMAKWDEYTLGQYEGFAGGSAETINVQI